MSATCRQVLCDGSNAHSKVLTRAMKRPTKEMKMVKSYMWCTYCGRNLEDGAAGRKVNRKEHWALHHTVQICHDMNVAVDEVDPSMGVIPKAFKSYLELAEAVLRSLRAYNYTVLPASLFFHNEGITPTDESDERKMEHLFLKFKSEAQEAFRKYKVVYLKGIKLPERYDDLLPASETTYRDVVWLDRIRPRSNTFAVRKDLTPDEADHLDLDAMTEFQNIIMSYE